MRPLLLFCLLGMLAACSSSKPLTIRESAHQDTERIGDVIRASVPKGDRSDALLQIQSNVEERTVGMFNELEEVRDDWADLNEDYDATIEQFELLTRRAATARRAAEADMIRLAMEARSVATADDWAAMAESLKEEK
jgi:hypothetical protein